MKKILLIVDVRNWAYDDAAKNWQELLKVKYDIDILYLSDYKPISLNHVVSKAIKSYQSAALTLSSAEKDIILKSKAIPGPIFNHRDYDGVYFFYHKALCDFRLLLTPIPMSKIAIAVNNEKWIEDDYNEVYNTYFKDTKVLAACNSTVIDSFKKIHPNVLRVSQSINEKVFYRTRDRAISGNGFFTVGWSGNYHNKYKNFKLVREGISGSKSRLLKAKDLSRSDLNLWYGKLDAVLCASKSEGGPLMILEAGACEIPIISTRVGLAREIIKNGETGFLVGYDKEDIARKILMLKKDKSLIKYIVGNMKKEIMENWTYKKRLYEIERVFGELTSD